MQALYRGFSLHQLQRSGTTKLQDLDLVKFNLLTHIYTSRGERLNMTTFGTRIPNLLFEPLDQMAVDVVREDLTQVFAYEPRVHLNRIEVTPLYDQNAILVTADLTYLELNTSEPFVIQLDFKQ
jgi:phage baseplate assembly protein W